MYADAGTPHQGIQTQVFGDLERLMRRFGASAS
jgi:hypothetical protein